MTHIVNAKKTKIEPKIGTLIVIALLIFVPLREVFAYYFVPEVKLTADILVLFLGGYAFYNHNYKIESLRITNVDFAFLFFLITISLSVATNHTDLSVALIQIRGFSIFYIAHFALRNIITDYVSGKRLVSAVFNITLTIMLLIAAMAVIEVVSAKSLFFFESWAIDISKNNIVRAYSILNNPNIFAAFLILSSLLIAACSNFLKKPVPKAIYIISVIGIALSLSRSGMLAGILSLLLLSAPLYLRKSSKRQRKLLAVFSTCAAAALIYLFILAQQTSTNYGENRLLDAINGNELRNSQIDGRIYIIDTSLNVFRANENPLFGIGPGELNNQTDKISKHGLKPGFTSDNQHLKVFVELGILGYASFLLFIGLLIKQFRRSPIALTSILVMLFLGLFFNSFEIQPLTLLFWLIIFVSEFTLSREKKVTSRVSSRKEDRQQENTVLYSVIVPAHNSSKFIHRLLDSVPNRKDIELIIIDDHSSDYPALQSLVNRQRYQYGIRLLKNPGKNSAGAARNIGLAAAEGRWILFADSDDTFTNDTEQILEYYKDSEASIVLFPPKATSSSPNTSSSRTSFMDFLFKSYHEGKISDKELLVRLTPIWSKLYKHEAIKGVIFNETRVANDVAFAARSALATINNIVVVDTSIYTVTERKGSLTQSKRRRIDRLAQRTAERIKSDIWLKVHLLQSGHRSVRLARHHSIFRKIFATRNQ